ncbi:2,4-dichlorophenol hydroxylase [Hyphodiscus hymeniophilus]|uniref:2,4-dichlorophenol hydroxylase n=1 Tax=Hyphodiscus hymeniophilus TaxID=353542 RepID=A0A9P6VKS1_9HELO|nr:2,4-dichlorophenol hydroxylase [Hyphodiscus hymeniophilus]
MSETNGVNGLNGHTISPPVSAASKPSSTSDLEIDLLIVGTGPAGGALAAFLASYGLKGLIVSRDSGNADSPRAHITNMAALDCLRDIGVDTDCYAIGTTGDSMRHTRWSNTMAGEEYARIYSWGNDPKRKGDYELASPSEPLDLPQTLLEPLLMRYATLNGFKCRWNTEFVSFVQDTKGGGITTTLFDNVTGQSYRVHSKYLFGCDGARSRIVKQLDLPLIVRPGQGLAVNILMEADMSHLMDNRKGNLHWILQPDQPDTKHPSFGWIGCMRMVKPWHEWLCIVFPGPGADLTVKPSEDDYLKMAHQFIGDDSVKVKVLGISTWQINEIAAARYSEGNILCLGDAVHRHPPNHGLGSNTCIQDAHNLAWKISYLLKGIAGEGLLESYNAERQPVGLDVITQANRSLRNHRKIWEILGVTEAEVAVRKAAVAELSADTPEGLARRERLQAALKAMDREEHGLGIEMNQRYNSSAIYKSDQGAPPTFTTDEFEHYHPTTYPGARLPHVWLNHATPATHISTIDLAGKGNFCLLTGIGGHGWKLAAKELSTKLGVPIAAYSIGFRQDYEDVYRDWAQIRVWEYSGAARLFCGLEM